VHHAHIKHGKAARQSSCTKHGKARITRAEAHGDIITAIAVRRTHEAKLYAHARAQSFDF